MADKWRIVNCWRKHEIGSISWKHLCNNNAIKAAYILCRPAVVLFSSPYVLGVERCVATGYPKHIYASSNTP